MSLVGGETLTGQCFIFSPRTAVIGIRMDGYSSARREKTEHFYVLGIHQLDKVVHDHVDAILMEPAMVAETEKIQFQALAFNHPDVRDVADADLCKVRLAGYGTEGSELRAVELHPIIPSGMHVLECLKYFGSIIHLVSSLMAQSFQAFFLPVHK